jgi:hypothetical protein
MPVASGRSALHAPPMFTVSEEDVVAIRAAFDRDGGLAAAIAAEHGVSKDHTRKIVGSDVCRRHHRNECRRRGEPGRLRPILGRRPGRAIRAQPGHWRSD